jgi:F420-dependent oxidoreductase-like protein
MTLDHLSGGRFLLGLGASGPQVVEGWHGTAYHKPLTRTREAVHIIRDVLARRAPLTYSGTHYQIPYDGADATGLGKPLKSILHGRADIPLYLAAMGPQNVQLAAEIADGWLPFLFAPRHYDTVYREQVEAGFAAGKRGTTYDTFDIAPSVMAVIGDDLDACRNRVRPQIALYVGGMGSRGKNFYNDLVSRYGYADAAAEIQDLYLNGKPKAAAAAVPDALVDEVALCGPVARIVDLLSEWQKAPITTLNLTSPDIETLRTMIDLVENL